MEQLPAGGDEIRVPLSETQSPVETVVKLLLALVPVVGGAGVVLWEDVRRHVARRLSLTADEVIAAVGADRLAERLAESPEFEALVVNALESAARTGYEAKRRLLARVLINAARGDDARVDESVLVQMAIRDLEAPHIRAAERIREAHDHATMTAEYRDKYPSSKPEDLLVNKRREEALAAGIGEPDTVVAALIRTGVAAPATLWDGGVGVAFITDFGRALLDYLRNVMLDWPPRAS